jgi:hypothetical protein
VKPATAQGVARPAMQPVAAQGRDGGWNLRDGVQAVSSRHSLCTPTAILFDQAGDPCRLRLVMAAEVAATQSAAVTIQASRVAEQTEVARLRAVYGAR